MRAVILGLMLLAAGAAQAAAQEGVSYFAGKWDVASKDPASGETLAMTYVVEPTLGGAWLAGAGAAVDGSYSARDMWGRDPLTGELIRVIFSDGAFGTVRSKGWAGERLVLEGETRSAGGTVRVRETITRISPQKFEAVWAAYRNGQWVDYAVETVTRRS
ncbi:hypothetical protein [Phenylobacterium sp.]|jgi:hypothetical protein|uniref:hypothetical protein n=1 Tax=Phenylobacterium sp. TaxID=1871053 RepID=UPI002F94CDFA